MTTKELTDKPYATAFKHLTDMKHHVGKELGLTDWYLITQEKIDTFAELTGDVQWIHVDVERSKKNSSYKGTVAHGFLILSLASKFSYETYSMADVTMALNYGLDRVRFPHATPAGSQVRGRLSLLEFNEFQGGARYKLHMVFEAQGIEKPVCVADFIVQAYTGH